MSSSNAENVTAVAHQDPHHIAAAEVTSEDVVISLVMSHQGTLEKLATSYNERRMDDAEILTLVTSQQAMKERQVLTK